MAKILNDYFVSVFNIENTNNIPAAQSMNCPVSIETLNITAEDVKKKN